MFSGRLLLSVGVSLLVAVAALVGYYANEVRLAREETPKVVAQAWRTYGKRIVLLDLPTERLRWLLAVEDPTFFEHRGVDLSTPGAGMTTITQGLVKLLYFPNGFHKGIAKFRQTLIAQYAFDSLVSKEEQLELLLNIAYLGHSNGVAVHGFARAANVYFHKDAASLSNDEFKALVAMLAAPDRFAPGSPALAGRVTRIDAYLSAAYRPVLVLDTEYDGKTESTFGEEALMAVLRLITHAAPQIRETPTNGNVLPFIPPGVSR